MQGRRSLTYGEVTPHRTQPQKPPTPSTPETQTRDGSPKSPLSSEGAEAEKTINDLFTLSREGETRVLSRRFNFFFSEEGRKRVKP